MKIHSSPTLIKKTKLVMGKPVQYEVTEPLVNQGLSLFSHLPTRRERRQALKALLKQKSQAEPREQ